MLGLGSPTFARGPGLGRGAPDGPFHVKPGGASPSVAISGTSMWGRLPGSCPGERRARPAWGDARGYRPDIGVAVAWRGGIRSAERSPWRSARGATAMWHRRHGCARPGRPGQSDGTSRRGVENAASRRLGMERGLAAGGVTRNSQSSARFRARRVMGASPWRRPVRAGPSTARLAAPGERSRRRPRGRVPPEPLGAPSGTCGSAGLGSDAPPGVKGAERAGARTVTEHGNRGREGGRGGSALESGST